MFLPLLMEAREIFNAAGKIFSICFDYVAISVQKLQSIGDLEVRICTAE